MPVPAILNGIKLLISFLSLFLSIFSSTPHAYIFSLITFLHLVFGLPFFSGFRLHLFHLYYIYYILDHVGVIDFSLHVKTISIYSLYFYQLNRI